LKEPGTRTRILCYALSLDGSVLMRALILLLLADAFPAQSADPSSAADTGAAFPLERDAFLALVKLRLTTTSVAG